MSGVALPMVGRARDFHLYTVDGRRLLDLYLDGGAALLGHRPERLGRELSSVMARGLIGNLPSVHGARLMRVLRRLLPGHRWFGIAASADDAWRLLRGRVAGLPATPADAADPLRDPGWREAPVAWWRPLCEQQPLGGVWLEQGPAALLHRLPFRIGAGPVTVSTRDPGGPDANRMAHLAAAAERRRGGAEPDGARRAAAAGGGGALAASSGRLAAHRHLSDRRLPAPRPRTRARCVPGRRRAVESRLSGAEHSPRQRQPRRVAAIEASVRHPSRHLVAGRRRPVAVRGVVRVSRTTSPARVSRVSQTTSTGTETC